MLLLLKNGYFVVDYPAKGIQGLICGDAHTRNREVSSHKKYIKASENGVRTFTVEALVEFLKISNLQ